ncbi:MAG TPA: DEAD/DEAH box helicase, partial [Candidatus Binatia bacterium]
DCLHEAMDLEGLKKIIAAIESGAINTLAVDTPAPSPMAHEILNANPYAFLDDAPLEERRARAVSLRRIDPRLEREFGQLDQSAIDEVCRQAWPEARNGDELHDFLLGVGILPVEERPDWARIAELLINNRRATEATWLPPGSQTPMRAYVAAETSELVRTCLPDVKFAPPVELPLGFEAQAVSEEEANRRILQGWMEAIGPTTVTGLSNRLGIESRKVESALLSLEGMGMVLRGRFTPSNGSDGEIEWCDRVLLARIHRLTLGRMRREIEPVSPVEFMSFLLSWQHVGANHQLEGRDGVLRVIQQLQGLELPAPAWEQWVLPARMRNYSPSDLEHLCLAGVVAWGRLRPEQSSVENLPDKLPGRRRRKRLAAPARNAPIAFLLREDLDYFLGHRSLRWVGVTTLSSSARDVARYLEQRGASFVADIARGAGLLKIKVEEALWELVAHGLATGDGIAGLRVLLLPEHKRQGKRHNLRVISGGRSAARMMPVGRWSLWSNQNGAAEVNSEQILERQARQLLERYGVVFRDLVAREANLPPWRTLLANYRRLEARGEIRGGRFVNGFTGEQFALPVAIEKLRAERRVDDKQQPLIISAADPLNLVGILTPGGRVSPYSNQVIAYHKGVPVQIGPLGSVLSSLQLNQAGEKP